MIFPYTPESYTARSSVGYLVRRASHLIVPQIEAGLVAHDLSFVQWVVLMALRDGMGQTAADIAREMCHDTGALTRVIDQLSQRGWVARTRSTDDRRVVLLELTESGQAGIEATIPFIVDRLNFALADFTKAEVETLTTLLAKLVKGVSRPVCPKTQTTFVALEDHR